MSHLCLLNMAALIRRVHHKQVHIHEAVGLHQECDK